MPGGHRSFVRSRTGWLLLAFALLYVGLGCRLAHVQVLHGDKYRKWAQRVRERKIALPASRGRICDRNGEVLAVSVEAASIFANRNELRDPKQTAVRVAALIGGEPGTLEERINKPGGSIVWLAMQQDPLVGDAVLKAEPKLRGVGVERGAKRVYPAGTLAAQVIGFTNSTGVGREGLEGMLNRDLSGKDGEMFAEVDPERRVIPETRRGVREPQDGKDVYLTIDIAIQHIAERALGKMAKTYRPESACAIVLRPQTGEILALANYPTYDPNKPLSAATGSWRNRAVADLYEPGSTLKVITAAAAVNEGVRPNEVVANCTGQEHITGGRIRCSLHHPYMAGHGSVDLYKMIQHSCNIAAAKLAFRMGSEKLYKYEKGFGLLDRIDAGFGCEAVASTLPPDKWRPMRLANVGFGQGIAVTPLQMAAAFGAIANDGVYVEPQIVREVRNPDGTVYSSFHPKRGRRVVSEEAARAVARMMATCVESGTGKTAAIEGRTVGGKTGSAQIALPKGGYESGSFIASFIGLAPVANPEIVIAVVVKRPKGSHWGATVAAPVFQEIGEKALWRLRVPSDAPAPEKNAPGQNGGGRSLV